MVRGVVRVWLRASMSLWGILWGTSVLLTYYVPAWAQILRYQGADGRLYFTSLPLPPALPMPQLDNTGSLPEEIPLRKAGGVYKLPIGINEVLTLHFILDTGASEVNIPADVVRILSRAGTIQNTDFLPGKTYVLADGSTLQSARFILRSLTIGSRRITNVPASIGPVASDLLLGQNMLEKFGRWGIDNQRKVLVIGAGAQGGRPTSRTAILATIIRQAQERLYTAGFDPGPKDGVLGARTREALQEYQRTAGLAVTGKLDAETIEALYDQLIVHTASRNSIEPALVKAVIKCGSRFDPGAQSPRGEQGLMQLMPGTAAHYRVENPFNPQANIEGGTRYLLDLLRMFPDDLRHVLAAYNAGPQTVIAAGYAVPDIPETQQYIRCVVVAYERYRTTMIRK